MRGKRMMFETEDPVKSIWAFTLHFYNVWKRRRKKLKREGKVQFGLSNVRWKQNMKLLGQVVSLKDKREPLIYMKEWRRVKGESFRAGRMCWFDPSSLWHCWQRGNWEESKVVNSQQELLMVFYCKENFTSTSYRWRKRDFKNLSYEGNMLPCTAFCKEFYRNVSKFPYLYYNWCQTHKKYRRRTKWLQLEILEKLVIWKSGYNFVNAVTFESGISYHEYSRKYLWRMPPGILLIFLIPYCVRHGAKRKLTLWRCRKKVHILHLFHRK